MFIHAACLLLIGLVLQIVTGANTSPATLNIPSTASGASIEHATSYVSFSIEPAFWVEFFGNASDPNPFTFDVLNLLVKHGGNPQIRPGGDTMDSMIFNASADNVVRTTSPSGGVYRTTVGPAYYDSWSNFPPGTKFTSTLNFQNDSLEIAMGLAVASVKYNAARVKYFELGNEPNNYGTAGSRWSNSTQAYVNQWLEWTKQIDSAVNKTLGRPAANQLGCERWWASSATTDNTTLQVKPVDIIPDGVDSANQVAEYSIHSYQFATCSPAQAALATMGNVLNHTLLNEYAEEQIEPSARAALDSGRRWIVGEYNSIACSGGVNVSNTFAQALWTVDTQLIYAVRNASATHLHQGATLVFQSSDQVNSAGANGTPGFSTYDMLYPRNSSLRGPARTLPGFLGVLYVVEALSVPNTRVRALETPDGLNEDYFSSYALYNEDCLIKLALINMQPYFSNSTSDFTASVDLSSYMRESGEKQAWVKRMTANAVDDQSSADAKWAGQSYEHGAPAGRLDVETVGRDGIVRVRGSEAVLVFFERDQVYGL